MGVPSCTEGLPLSTAPEWICPTVDNTSPSCSTLEWAWKWMSVRHELIITKPSLIYEQWLASYLITHLLNFNISVMTIISVAIHFVSNTKSKTTTTVKNCEMRKSLHILKFICMVLGVLNIGLIVPQGWLQISEWCIQTYPLWHLIISNNHVFDCIPLISGSNCRHPAIQRQSCGGLKILLIHSQCLQVT
jgi:hypothetical protein